MDTQIYVGNVLFSTVNTNSGVLNKHKDWKASSKGNSAIGRVNGDGNIITSNLNYVEDRDFFDTMTNTK
ncbi:MAG: hypothetical protein JG781_529 [Peptococcaceae bacterium]|nr:hypothetical protein [Peptococcaceae bacterium]